MPELLYGERAPETVTAPDDGIDRSLDDDLTLPDADVFYALLEIPMAAARATLPVSLHPSVPALIGITVWRIKDGPFGPFNLGYVGIACRTGIKPRHFVTSSFCNDERAGDFLRRRYGLSCRTAEVTYRETYDRVATSVIVDGAPVLGVRVSEMVPLTGAGASVKYSPPLCPARVADRITLVQFEAGYDFKRVLRGVPVVEHYDAGTLGTGPVAPAHPVSATHAICDVHLHAVRFVVDPELPAERGGARRITD